MSLTERTYRRQISFRVGGASRTGARAENDDAYRIDGSAALIAVSDGIGGAPDGDVMSRVATGRCVEAYAEARDLLIAFASANRTVAHIARLLDSPDSGATLLAATFSNEGLRVAWVGDSVAYRLHNGVLGLITDVGRRGNTNVLESAVGYEDEVAPHVAECEVAPGDRFLFCTDGVWEPFEEVLGLGRLSGLLTDHDNAPMLAGAIVDEAVGHGTDNATAVVLLALPDDPKEDA